MENKAKHSAICKILYCLNKLDVLTLSTIIYLIICSEFYLKSETCKISVKMRIGYLLPANQNQDISPRCDFTFGKVKANLIFDFGFTGFNFKFFVVIRFWFEIVFQICLRRGNKYLGLRGCLVWLPPPSF